MENKINNFLHEIKKDVDQTIEHTLINDNPMIDGLYKSASYSISGGKRVRAVFTYLIGQMFGVKNKKLHITACAVEMIHAASLIMDDLPYMDDSQLRRGKPANHVVFGQDVALCASIALISKSLDAVLNDNNLDQKDRNQVAQVLTHAYGFDGLAAGQYVDLKLKHKNIDFEIIKYINRKKTSALFTAAGKAAAIIGNATSEQLNAIEDYSDNIGFAFQIIDDLLDETGHKNIVGKDTASDKMNFVKLVGKEEAEKQAKIYSQKALTALKTFGEKAKELKQFTEFLESRLF